MRDNRASMNVVECTMMQRTKDHLHEYLDCNYNAVTQFGAVPTLLHTSIKAGFVGQSRFLKRFNADNYVAG
jgi:hypothetical protein